MNTMKQLRFAFVLTHLLASVLFLGAGAVHAQNLGGLAGKLRTKVETLTPQKQLNVATAVGGVRGAAAGADDIYWKGESRDLLIDADELGAFQKALGLVEANKAAEAKAAFADFVKQYPDSRLKADAEEAIRELN